MESQPLITKITKWIRKMNKNMKTISNTLHSPRRKPNILSPKIYHPNQNVSYLNVNPAVSVLSVISRNLSLIDVEVRTVGSFCYITYGFAIRIEKTSLMRYLLYLWVQIERKDSYST